MTLLGPSGCGKTTILRLISGLDSVSEGKVFIEGQDIYAPEVDVTRLRKNVGMVFGFFALYFRLY